MRRYDRGKLDPVFEFYRPNLKWLEYVWIIVK